MKKLQSNRAWAETERYQDLFLSKLLNSKTIHQEEQALISEHTFYFHPNFFCEMEFAKLSEHLRICIHNIIMFLK